SQEAKNIIQTIRDRLESTGYPVLAGRSIDVETDAMPILALKLGDPPGIQTEELGRYDRKRQISRQTMALVVLAAVHVDPRDALLELEDFASVVHGAIFKAQEPRMDGLLTDQLLLESRHAYVPDEHSDVGVIEMRLRLSYIEEY